jgi:hypothetical protein
LIAPGGGGITPLMRNIAVAVVLVAGAHAAADSTKVTMKLGAPIITGTYDQKTLNAAFKKSTSKLVACFKKSGRSSATEANATFTIAGDGKITNVSVSGLDEIADTCVAGVVAKMKVTRPKMKEPVEVTHTLTFEPVVPAPQLVQGGAFASLTGTGDISSGFDDANIYGGLLGSEVGEPSGGGGGWGTIGTGRYGTIGSGSGTGGMRGRPAAVPSISVGQPEVTGDLDKAIIRRYIKRNIQKLLYCYEKELLAKPDIQGVVTAEFTISPNGTVSAASATGIATVDQCVANVIRGIEFPKPKGAAEVKVKYPITYRLPEKQPAAKKK